MRTITISAMFFTLFFCLVGHGMSDQFEYHKFWRRFDQAQKEYLKGSLEASKTHFSNLLNEYANEKNLPERERKLVFYSGLRAAQLSKIKRERHSTIKKTIAFAPELRPDPVIFPPAFITSFKQLSQDTPIRKTTKDNQQRQPIIMNFPRKLSQTTIESQSWFEDRSSLIWIGLIGASVYAGYKVYEHNNQRPSTPSIVIPNTEIKSF